MSRKPEPRAKKQPARPRGKSSIQALSAYGRNHLRHAGAGRRAGAIDRRHPLLGIRAHREQRHALLVLRLGLRFLRLPHRLQDELELLVFASRCGSWGGGLEPKG